MYWIDAITLWGFEARMEDISERDMHALMPLLGELGAAASFGKAGTDVLLGGCLASDPRDRSGGVMILQCPEPKRPFVRKLGMRKPVQRRRRRRHDA